MAPPHQPTAKSCGGLGRVGRKALLMPLSSTGRGVPGSYARKELMHTQQGNMSTGVGKSGYGFFFGVQLTASKEIPKRGILQRAGGGTFSCFFLTLLSSAQSQFDWDGGKERAVQMCPEWCGATLHHIQHTNSCVGVQALSGATN